MLDNRPIWAREEVVFLVFLLGSSIGAWFLPDEYLYVVFGVLALGVCSDLLSLSYHVKTLVTGRFSSGFSLVGLVFYAWFLLAYPQRPVLSSD